ncbi:MAG: copper transporter [Acidimicrobiia bacterium]
MINFRFHLVSLIAVFLALALGIVIGSTLIDRAIVDALRNRIDTVESNLDDRVAANDALRSEVDRQQEYVDGSAPYALDGRLSEVPVVVLAAAGVDDDIVSDTVDALRQAGGSVPGIVWLTDAWSLDSDDEVEALASALAAGSTSPSGVRELGLRTLANEVGAGGDAPAFDALADAGFVEFAPVGDVAPDPAAITAEGARVVLIDGHGSSVDGPAWIEPLIAELTAVGRPTVLAQITGPDEDSGGPGSVALVRDDEILGAAVSTVDDLGLVEGRVATALALEALGEGRVGHYGYGPGADSAVPVFVGP